MAEHTHGPWISRDVTEGDDPDCGAWVVEIPATGGNTVRRLYFGDMENNTGEDIANADVAAAAPKLLVACRCAERLLSITEGDDPKPVRFAPDTLAILRAAIAQATAPAPAPAGDGGAGTG
jgi:hypothetical protein